MATPSFSLVTISDAAASAPSWRSASAHVAVDAALASRRRWTAQIDRAILDADRHVLLVSQGIGCLAAACWARLSPHHYVTRIADAVFIDPPAPGAGFATFASPETPLPFRSTVLSSADHDARLRDMIDGWGSRLAPVARRRLPRTPLLMLVERLTHAVVAHDVERALSLLGQND